MSTGAAIDIFKEGRVLTSVSLAPPKREWTVGRSLDSDICINHPSVSRVHCRISEDDGAYFISDCASVHGTRMNRQPLPPNLQMRLFDGLTIELGSSSRSLVPRGTVASVVAAALTAAQQAAAAEKRRPPLTLARLPFELNDISDAVLALHDALFGRLASEGNARCQNPVDLRRFQSRFHLLPCVRIQNDPEMPQWRGSAVGGNSARVLSRLVWR